jgi:transposase
VSFEQALRRPIETTALITKSTRKDDRHDARTLARLARIDPELLGPVRHRSAQAQIHLTVIRARAELHEPAW